MTDNQQIARMVIRTLVEGAQGDSGVSDQDRRYLIGLGPVEIEQAAARCCEYVNVDIDHILREIRRTRNETVIRKFVRAGCSNQLLRELFGLTLRDLTRLRTEAPGQSPGRPRRLTEAEEKELARYCRASPIPEGSDFLRAAWCLEARHELDIPFMSIHRYIAQRPKRSES